MSTLLMPRCKLRTLLVLLAVGPPMSADIADRFGA